MKYLQKGGLKIVGTCIILIITFLQPACGQVSQHRLRVADSLYQAKLYTQSFEHYEEILRQKFYTPAMLLKMAYIQEGLNNVGRAMYYLNLYFLVSNDDTVLGKMEELAAKFNLNGYETSETDQLLTFYHDNYFYISLSLCAVIIFFLALAFNTRIRRKQRPVIATVMLGIFAVAFLAHLNIGERVKHGIITDPETYVMDGPSPASNLRTIAKDGHRVEVIGKKDVWLKIMWDGETAYIRQSTLLPIEL